MATALLLQLLHCKQKSLEENCQDQRESTSSQWKKRKVTSMALRKGQHSNEILCRVCLKPGDIPIYTDETTSELSEQINEFGGIKIISNDKYSKYICKVCHDLLQGAILFRKTAQESDMLRNQSEKIDAIIEGKDEEEMEDEETNSLKDEWSDCDIVDEDVDYELNTDFFIDNKNFNRKKRVYKCNSCQLDFSTQREFKEHKLSRQHVNNAKFTCKLCNQQYGKSYYNRHMSKHKNENLYICDVCGKSFPIKGVMTRHRLTHYYDLPFKCNLCPYKGRFRNSLKHHMKSHNPEVKEYKCPECPDRAFAYSSNLKRHLLSHKQDFDFKCEICGRGFHGKRKLELHHKVYHNGIKDYECDICGKCFGYRKQMMKHQLKVHKREKRRCGKMPIYIIAETRQEDVSS